jgi:hypothetical protein
VYLLPAALAGLAAYRPQRLHNPPFSAVLLVQRTLYEDNSILRGGRDPVIAEPAGGRTMRELEIE